MKQRVRLTVVKVANEFFEPIHRQVLNGKQNSITVLLGKEATLVGNADGGLRLF